MPFGSERVTITALVVYVPRTVSMVAWRQPFSGIIRSNRATNLPVLWQRPPSEIQLWRSPSSALVRAPFPLIPATQARRPMGFLAFLRVLGEAERAPPVSPWQLLFGQRSVLPTRLMPLWDVRPWHRFLAPQFLRRPTTTALTIYRPRSSALVLYRAPQVPRNRYIEGIIDAVRDIVLRLSVSAPIRIGLTYTVLHRESGIAPIRKAFHAVENLLADYVSGSYRYKTYLLLRSLHTLIAAILAVILLVKLRRKLRVIRLEDVEKDVTLLKGKLRQLKGEISDLESRITLLSYVMHYVLNVLERAGLDPYNYDLFRQIIRKEKKLEELKDQLNKAQMSIAALEKAIDKGRDKLSPMEKMLVNKLQNAGLSLALIRMDQKIGEIEDMIREIF